MAQRQVAIGALKQAWTCFFSNSSVQTHLLKKSTESLLACSAINFKNPLSKKAVAFVGNPATNYSAQALSEKNKGFIDLFTNNPHKELYLPTLSVNKLKVYEDITSSKSILDPVINNIKIIDVPVPGQPEKKEAVRMILIRRRKMRKHKLKRFRKKWKNVLLKIKVRRELRKEQAFRVELLSQVEAADNFDAKEYVEKTLKTIRHQPKLETVEEIKARYREIMKMNKYKTMFIRPKFDD